MPLSYDLTTFQILGQNLPHFFVGILVQTMTPKGHFEINWLLVNVCIQKPSLNQLYLGVQEAVSQIGTGTGLVKETRYLKAI